MRTEDHIIATESILELRGLRAWNRSAADLISGSVDVPDEQPETVLGNGSSSILGAAHKGLTVFQTTEGNLQFWDGSAWCRSSKPYKSGSAWPDFSMTNGNILTGSGGVMTEIGRISVAVSEWGTATGNVDMGTLYKIINLATPTNDNDAANKIYVDNVASGIQPKDECEIASNQALPSCVYDGAAGTLTASVNSALANTDIDTGASGVTLTAGIEGTGTRILVKNQASAFQNGLYRLSTQGSGAAKWVLTRCDDSDTNDELRAAYTYIRQGTNAGKSYIQQIATSGYDIAPGSGTLNFVVYFQASVYAGGPGIDISGNTISAKIDAAASWAANKVVITGTNTLLTASTSKSNAPLWYSGSAPAFAAWGLQNPTGSGDNGDIYYYNHSSLAMTAVPSRALNRVMTTDASGIPLWSTDLPGGTTIGTKTPLFNDAVVAISIGGTGANLSGGSIGSMIWRNSASTFASTSTQPTATGFIPMVTSYTNASTMTIDMVNLFSRSNTWTGSNIYESAVGIRSSGDTQNRLTFNGLGPAGGRIMFGAGSSTAPDIYIERRTTRQLQMTATDGSNTASWYLATNHTFTGPGKWQAGVIQRNYGGLGVDNSAWAEGSLPFANASGSFTSTGAGISGSFLTSAVTWAGWSSWALPASVVAGDMLYATSSTQVSVLAKPANDNYLLSLQSGLPVWRPFSATRGSGINGSGAILGSARIWATFYNGSGAASRTISFTHPLGSRNVVVSARRTNSDDSLNPSEQVATRCDVVDENTVRVWFSSTPTNSDNYVITVVG